MNVKRVTLATIAVWLAGFVLIMLTCGWLFTWIYAIPPNIWLTPEAMQSAGNMAGSILTGIIRALVFVLVFIALYRGIPGKGVMKGVCYGAFVWLIGAFAGMISMPFYMTISTTVVIYWTIQALVLNLISGAITAAIIKKP